MITIKLYRMWINQPSTLQRHHKYHAMNVLAQEIDEDYYRIWFTKGDVISMEIEGLALSEGWNTQNEH